MKCEVVKMEDGLLKRDYQLYSALASKDSPNWWKILKSDKSLYFEVRKKNIIDVYYFGGRVAEIKVGRGKQINVTCHPKYLDNNPSSYKVGKDGKKYPIYQDCSKQIVNNLESLKDNIVKYYSKEAKGTQTSEKYIQGQLIIQHPELHLDSEFAYRFFKGERKTVRIDLISVENNNIIFYELKRITDSRLNSSDDNPEIIEQMTNYKDFLVANKDVLCNYYKTLIQIKTDLNLDLPENIDVNSLEVDVNPRLLVDNTYNNMNTRQRSRWNNIKSVLQRIGIIPILIEKGDFK